MEESLDKILEDLGLSWKTSERINKDIADDLWVNFCGDKRQKPGRVFEISKTKFFYEFLRKILEGIPWEIITTWTHSRHLGGEPASCCICNLTKKKIHPSTLAWVNIRNIWIFGQILELMSGEIPLENNWNIYRKTCFTTCNFNCEILSQTFVSIVYFAHLAVLSIQTAHGYLLRFLHWTWAKNE